MVLRPNASYGLLIQEISRSYTTTHHSRQDSSGRVISSSQRSLPDNIAHKRDIHPCPLRDSNPNLSRRAAVDLSLRPRGHWDRQKKNFTFSLFPNTCKDKGKFCLSQPWKHKRRAEIQPQLFLTSVLDEDGWLDSRSGRFAPMERAPVPFELEVGYAFVGFGEEESLLLLSRIEARTVGPLTIMTTLFRLHRYVLTSKLPVVPAATFWLI